jgi:hypothetical protein
VCLSCPHGGPSSNNAWAYTSRPQYPAIGTSFPAVLALSGRGCATLLVEAFCELRLYRILRSSLKVALARYHRPGRKMVGGRSPPTCSAFVPYLGGSLLLSFTTVR